MILALNYLRLLLRHCFEQLRSTQVAVVHCSAQTSPMHVLQKLQQSCMVISSNTGRVYRPKDCERLVLYLKDLNLPKPDKWGTSQLIAFLQQVKHFAITGTDATCQRRQLKRRLKDKLRLFQLVQFANFARTEVKF